MKKILILTIFSFLISALPLQALENLLIDDFEGLISTGPTGTIETGTNGDSTIEVTADTVTKYSGEQSLKVVFNIAPETGSAWVAKGETPDSQWLVSPQDINWDNYSALSFYIYGSNSATPIKLHIVDSEQEIWEYAFINDFTGWKQVICDFSSFYTTPDWQTNEIIDFPIKSFAFVLLPGEKNTLYIDRAELVAK